MKKTLSLIAISLIFTLVACESSDEPALNPADVPMVVEGWIEEGRAPIVMVTHAVDLTVDNPSFDSIPDPWCRVIIYDNDTPNVLTLRKSDAYMPPLIYTSSRLKGRVGHTYRLVVESEKHTLTATATLTKSPRIDSVRTVPVPGTDSLFSLTAYTSNIQPGTYHKYFTKTIGVDPRPYPTFLGNVAADSYNPETGTPITRGKRAPLDDSTAQTDNHYYRLGQTVIVQCSSMDRDIYDLWRVYDSNISFSDNLFITFTSNLPSNIQGGLGYFAAYGITEKAIRIK